MTLRLHITGNAGAGKTTLAKALAARLHLPLHHLDQIAWLPGWQKPDVHAREQAERQLVSGAAWIIEGVSDIARTHADYTFFIDVPRHICLLRCCKRNIPYLFRSRPELPDRCPEILILRKLASIIWHFPTRAGARIAQDASEQPNVIRIAHSADAEQTVQKWLSSTSPGSTWQALA